MELKNFVSQTLQEIISGIKDAQNSGIEEGGTINPPDQRGGNSTYAHGLNGNPIQNIDFDIAVTVIEGKETKGGIGVFTGSVGLGTQGRSDTSNTSYSRIKFCIPVTFPQQSEER
jgi:hypothetical protein